MRPRLAILSATLAVAALTVAGCSGGNPTASGSSAPATPTATDNGVSVLAPADILTRTLAALGSAGSAHLVGTIGTAMVDVLASGGNLQVHSSGPDGDLEARLIGSDLYYKGDAAFYRGLFPKPTGDQMAAARAGKWVKSSAAKDPQVSSVIGLLTPTNIVQVIALAATPSKGATTQVGGQPALELKITSPAGNGSVFVATTGAPVPLQIKLDRLPAPIMITCGAPVTISAPTPDITA